MGSKIVLSYLKMYLLYLHGRNAMLGKTGVKMPTARKTGTTIAGIVFKVWSFCMLMYSIFATKGFCILVELIEFRFLLYTPTLFGYDIKKTHDWNF